MLPVWEWILFVFISFLSWDTYFNSVEYMSCGQRWWMIKDSAGEQWSENEWPVSSACVDYSRSEVGAIQVAWCACHNIIFWKRQFLYRWLRDSKLDCTGSLLGLVADHPVFVLRLPTSNKRGSWQCAHVPRQVVYNTWQSGGKRRRQTSRALMSWCLMSSDVIWQSRAPPGITVVDRREPTANPCKVISLTQPPGFVPVTVSLHWPWTCIMARTISKPRELPSPQSSGAVWKSRWPPWAPRPINSP